MWDGIRGDIMDLRTGRWIPRTPPSPPRQEERSLPPLPAQLVAEHDAKPLGAASAGESYAGGVPGPLQPFERFQPEPPPWADLDGPTIARLAAEAAANENAAPPVDALTAMKLASDDIDEPQPWAPVDTSYVPALPPEIPKPDWRQEEAERLALEKEERERAAREQRVRLLEELVQELGGQQERYPARRQR